MYCTYMAAEKLLEVLNGRRWVGLRHAYWVVG